MSLVNERAASKSRFWDKVQTPAPATVPLPLPPITLTHLTPPHPQHIPANTLIRALTNSHPHTHGDVHILPSSHTDSYSGYTLTRRHNELNVRSDY